jgi:hypothetical protein
MPLPIRIGSIYDLLLAARAAQQNERQCTDHTVLVRMVQITAIKVWGSCSRNIIDSVHKSGGGFHAFVDSVPLWSWCVCSSFLSNSRSAGSFFDDGQAKVLGSSVSSPSVVVVVYTGRKQRDKHVPGPYRYVARKTLSSVPTLSSPMLLLMVVPLWLPTTTTMLDNRTIDGGCRPLTGPWHYTTPHSRLSPT